MTPTRGGTVLLPRGRITRRFANEEDLVFSKSRIVQVRLPRFGESVVDKVTTRANGESFSKGEDRIREKALEFHVRERGHFFTVYLLRTSLDVNFFSKIWRSFPRFSTRRSLVGFV